MAAFLATACYAPEQRRLEREIHKLVTPGMPGAVAMKKLESAQFSCTGTDPMTCARIRQRVLPSSCVERVNITLDKAAFTVKTIDVAPTLCAGM